MTYQAVAKAPEGGKTAMPDPMGRGKPPKEGRRSVVAMVVVALLCLLCTLPTVGLLVTSGNGFATNAGLLAAYVLVMVLPAVAGLPLQGTPTPPYPGRWVAGLIPRLPAAVITATPLRDKRSTASTSGSVPIDSSTACPSDRLTTLMR